MNGKGSAKRKAFDEVARKYDQVRPGYPDAMYDDIIAFSYIPAGGNILEIGCGTGQATLPFARLGYQIQCIEIGEHLAQVARENLADFPKIKVVTGDFEAVPLEEAAYDLVISGTAFHWINPGVGYPKIARLLHSCGSIALFWNKHVHHNAGAAFFEAVQEIYRQEVPDMAKEDWRLPLPEQVSETAKEDIERTGLFGPVTVYKYPWETVYSAEAYVHLLDTYSDHRSLAEPVRARLFRRISDLIDRRFGGQITKGYLTILFLARRK